MVWFHKHRDQCGIDKHAVVGGREEVRVPVDGAVAMAGGIIKLDASDDLACDSFVGSVETQNPLLAFGMHDVTINA